VTPRKPAAKGSARLYECRISHVRTVPLRNVFTYHTYMWLVDLDRLPRPRTLMPLARFSARDHLGDPERGIRENLDRFLAERDVDLNGGQVLMLAHARVFGYVFNPLTVYWCHRPDGTLACVVAEVHNTYGERHAYLLHTDGRGRAEVPKQFYVSPFYPVDGRYRMSLPEPGDRLALSIALGRPSPEGSSPEDSGPEGSSPEGSSPEGSTEKFTAGVQGRAVPATARTLAAAALRHPWSTAVVSARIRWQGSKLYLRGLRPVPRPAHQPQEGVQ
jgi:uncharacterized protein